MEGGGNSDFQNRTARKRTFPLCVLPLIQKGGFWFLESFPIISVIAVQYSTPPSTTNPWERFANPVFLIIQEKNIVVKACNFWKFLDAAQHAQLIPSSFGQTFWGCAF